MMKLKYSSFLFLLMLAGCANSPKTESVVQRDEAGEASQGIIGHPAGNDDKDSNYPKMELSSQMLYQFLLSDIAAQRGQVELAAQGYLDLARKTRDLRAVRRAAQLAYESRQMNETIAAFKLWSELEPTAVMPKQMLATVLLSGGKLEEARPYLVDLLKADPDNAGRTIVQVYPLLARGANKLAVYELLREISLPYQNLAEMHWVLAQAANAAALPEVARQEAKSARLKRPDWELAILLDLRMQLPVAPAATLADAKQYLQKNEDTNEVRMFYARALLEQKQYKESREQFQILLKKQPENTEVAFAIALLSIQMGELDRAEKELKQTLAAGRKDTATVHYYLAQLQEAKKDDSAALAEYEQISEGEYLFPSRLRMAFILNKNGKLDEARQMLQQTKARTNEQRVQLILFETQMLREAQKYEMAYKVISKGMEKLPNDPELLYEAGMLADRMGKFDLAEKMLRKLIKVSPDHAHAYNALGYSLLERKERLAEAMKLVEKAYSLAPDDAAIMDSMGWGYYLNGDLPKGLEFMRRAYAANRDAEIAAHLGEVLWKTGARDEARKIWQQSLEEHPGHKVLQKVMKRFMP